MTDLTLTIERIINTTQEDTFSAWLDVGMLRKFMTPSPEMTVPMARSDAKQGGRFDIVMQAGEKKMPHAGTYKEIVPYERIVFTWESPFSTDDSTVTLTFAPVSGGTHVTLHHVRFIDEENRNNHKGGWDNILTALSIALS